MQTAVTAVVITRICNYADRPIRRPHTREEIVNTSSGVFRSRLVVKRRERLTPVVAVNGGMQRGLSLSSRKGPRPLACWPAQNGRPYRRSQVQVTRIHGVARGNRSLRKRKFCPPIGGQKSILVGQKIPAAINA